MNPSTLSNPTTSLIDQAQQQAEQNVANDNPLQITPSSGSTLDQQSNGSQAPVTPTGGSQPSLLQRLLPTAGGIGGSILGTALAPETGGLSLLIPALAAGLGSAGGKVAENATDNKGLGSGVLASGVEGAAGQGLAEGAGSLLGKGGNILKNAGAKVAEETAGQTENSQALEEALANKNNFGGVRPEVQKTNNMAGNQDLLKNWGVDATDPQAMNTAAKGGLFIDDIDKGALSAGSPIKTTDLLSTKDITTATPAEQQAFADSGIITPQGDMPSTVTPLQANQFAQSINNQLRDTASTLQAAKNAGRAQDASVLQGQYNNLNKLYKNVQQTASTPEVNAAIEARTVTPEEKQALVEQYGDNEASHIEQAINNATTHQDLVNAKLPFAQMDNLSSQAMEDLKANGTARAVARTKQASGGSGLNTGTALDLGGAYEGLVRGHPLGLLAPLAYHTMQNPEALAGLGGLASKVGESVAPGIAGQVVGNSPNDVPGAANGSTGLISPAINGANNPYNLAIESALLNGNSGAAGTYTGDANKLNAATAAEQNLAQIFNQAGGAQGPLGGHLGILGSLFTGGQAGSYGPQAAADAEAIAAATGQSSQVVEAALPKLTQDQSAAQASLGNIQSLIEALQGGNPATSGLISAQ